ncbi:hypothetical protein C5167_028399 [Papaver somniferum]|nr:hypothetical protein C5167_028399 [Papaver somniferum]
MAWHSIFSRMQLHKNQTLESYITRQEADSMVSRFFPIQLLLGEYPHYSWVYALNISYLIVIANDLGRCNLLIHQTEIMCCANLIVINHEAQHFPSCNLSKKWLIVINFCSMESYVTIHEAEPLFARLLTFGGSGCYLLASGIFAFTLSLVTLFFFFLRCVSIFIQEWRYELHLLQVQIAMCGMVLLNNIRELKFVSFFISMIKSWKVELNCSLGIKSWKVRDKGVSKDHRTAIVPSMFPSGQSFDAETVVPSGLDENVVSPGNDNEMVNVTKCG